MAAKIHISSFILCTGRKWQRGSMRFSTYADNITCRNCQRYIMRSYMLTTREKNRLRKKWGM